MITPIIDETLRWMARVALADGYLSPEEIKVMELYALSRGVDPEPVVAALQEAAGRLDPAVVPLHRNLLRGIEFENTVARRLSAMDGVRIESRSADFKRCDREIADDRSFLPDFLLRHKFGRFTLRYWLECKYRSKCGNVSFYRAQVDRYAEAQHRDCIPAFMIIGTGGKPSQPAAFHLFPIDDIVSCRCARMVNSSYIIPSDQMKHHIIDIESFELVVRRFLDA